MRTAWLVAVVELRRRLRDRSVLVVAVVAPVALASLMGVAFGSVGGELRLGVVGGRAVAPGQLGASALPAGGTARIVPFGSAAALRHAVSTGQVDAGIVAAPAAGGSLRVEVVSRPAQLLATAAATAVAQALLRSLEERRLVAAATTGAGAVRGPPGRGGAAGSSRAPGRAGDGGLGGSPVSLVVSSGSQRRNLIGYFGPSMAVVFSFFVASVGARGLLAERQAGTLARLRAAPVRLHAVVFGKVLAMFLTALASMGVLWAVTDAGFGGSWGPLGPVALAILATSAAMTGVGAVVTTFSTDLASATAASGIAGFLLAFAGGNFFPPGALPAFFVDVSRATPNGWALQAFGTLALDRGSLGQVAVPLAVLGGMAVVFSALAWRRVAAVVVSA
jgi:ABC-2 type transport system permease protein